MFNILIIDDTKSVHAFMKSILSKSPDIHTFGVFDGKQALEHLKSEKNYDLILLDWEMPVLNGPSTFQAFVEAGIKIPTMMMTTKNNPEDIQKMLEMGVAEYLMKPFTIDILFAKIESVTGKSFTNAA